MTINNPLKITSRLLPGLTLGGVEISLGYSRNPGHDGRTRYVYYLDCDLNKKSHKGEDLQSGCCGGSIQEGFESLLSFLSACGEAYRYKMAHPESEPENLDLFPDWVAEWAYLKESEISMLEWQLTEDKNVISED